VRRDAPPAVPEQILPILEPHAGGSKAPPDVCFRGWKLVVQPG
jgi:hypothetical protein